MEWVVEVGRCAEMIFKEGVVGCIICVLKLVGVQKRNLKGVRCSCIIVVLKLVGVHKRCGSPATNNFPMG